MMKRCSKCETTKSIDRFRPRVESIDGWHHTCRDCQNITRRARMAVRSVNTNVPPPDAFATDEPTSPGAPAFDGPVNDSIPTVAELAAARAERHAVSGLKTQLKAALDELAACRLSLATVLEVAGAQRDVDPIVARERSSTKREATFVALASDWHIEEHVDPGLVNGVNSYDLNEAHRRVERYFGGIVYLNRYHADHFIIRDGILWLGGDLITGYLREENLEANECSPVEAIATLLSWLTSGIRYVLEQLPDLAKLRIVCNSGNHGRLTDKVRPSTREKNSIEWLLYCMLAREFAKEPRIEVTLPTGVQTYVDVYNTTIRFLHGDCVKYGGGVGGILIPIYKALARWETVRHAHLTVMGHWHSYHDMSDLVVNGSLIGYSAYSMEIGARHEVPRQGFFLVDSRRGKTMPSDIWVREAS